MNDKIILIHAIMLLYWESKSGRDSEGSTEIVLSIIDKIKTPESTIDTDSNKEIITCLKNIANALCRRENKVDPIDKDYLLQILKVNLLDNIELIDVLLEGTQEDETTDVSKKCLIYADSVNRYYRKHQFREKLKSRFGELIYGQNNDDNIESQAASLMNDLEEFATVRSEEQGVMAVNGVVTGINFADSGSVEQTFKEAEDDLNTEGILKTGFQGINRMFGWHGGIRRGDLGFIAAFQHNFKTGFVMKLFKQISLYNKPHMFDPNKKPMLLFIGAEDHATDILLRFYEDLYENEYGVQADLKNLNRIQATEYVVDRMGSMGYHVEFYRINPSSFGYREYYQVIMSLESQGYEIHLAAIDYLNMFSKEGCIQGPTGSETRDLYRRIRNFNSVRKIATATPHQISTEAKVLLRQDVDLIVKEFPGKSYLDSCKTIDQETDWGMYIHIEKKNGRKYLTVARDKHRKSGPQTPEEDLFCILPFEPIGSLRDDINGEDTTLYKLNDVKDEQDWSY